MCNLGWKTACKMIIFTERYPAQKNMDPLSSWGSPLDVEKKIRFEEKKTVSTFHLDHHQRLPLWEPAKFFKQLEKSFCSPLRPRQTEVLSQKKFLAAKKNRKLHRGLLDGRQRLATVNCATSLIAFIWHSQNRHWVLGKAGLQNIGQKFLLSQTNYWTPSLIVFLSFWNSQN